MQYIKLEEKFMMDITQERLLARKKKLCVYLMCVRVDRGKFNKLS